MATTRFTEELANLRQEDKASRDRMYIKAFAPLGEQLEAHLDELWKAVKFDLAAGEAVELDADWDDESNTVTLSYVPELTAIPKYDELQKEEESAENDDDDNEVSLELGPIDWSGQTYPLVAPHVEWYPSARPSEEGVNFLADHFMRLTGIKTKVIESSRIALVLDKQGKDDEDEDDEE